MIIKTVAKLLLFLISCLLLILLTLSTETGMHILLLISKISPYQIQIEKLSGSLLTGKLELKNLTIKKQLLIFKAEDLQLVWQPKDLLKGILQLDELKIFSPRIKTNTQYNSGIITSAGTYYFYDSKLKNFNIQWTQLPFTTSGNLDIKYENSVYNWSLNSIINIDKENIREITGAGTLNHVNETWNLQDFYVTSNQAKLIITGFLNHNSQIKYKLDIPDISDFNHQISGAIKAEGNVIGNLKNLKHNGKLDLINLKTETGANLNTSLTINQKLKNNSILGEILAIAKVKLPLSGITLKTDNFIIRQKDFVNFNWQGDIASNEGKIKIHGKTITTSAPLKTVTKIYADNFLFKNTFDAIVSISGNIELQQTGSSWHCEANLTIPKANLAPKKNITAQKISKDVKILDKEEVDKISKFIEEISANIYLNIAKPINFSGFNLKSAIKGKLNITKPKKQITLASGELELINATYNLYGNKINVDSGQLVYTRSPLENPLLHIIASKNVAIKSSVKGNLQLTNLEENNNQQKGVIFLTITGTANKPKLTFSSDPIMPESDQISYLLLDVPSNAVNTAQGKIIFTAVQEMASSLGFEPEKSLIHDMQKWSPVDEIDLKSTEYVDGKTGENKMQPSLILKKSIGSKLSLEYTVGLINPINTVKAELFINEKWHVQTEINNFGQGSGDLIYQIER